ncbi:MAG: efflux RND transporter periplasmic adaptor subunit [Candidatus Rariloculaceae bacterium]
MINRLKKFGLLLLTAALAACGGDMQMGAPETAMVEEEVPERGPNNGVLFADGDFVLELAIFETGIPPEYRAWATNGGETLAPRAVDIEVRLTRLGNVVDEIGFAPQGDYLRGDTVIYEPHSFAVSIEATHAGQTHRWEFDSFEGRTEISPQMAEAFGITTEIAGPATLEETATVYGQIAPNTERVRDVRARFDGAIRSVDVSLGQTVTQGQALATVESNESLNAYTIEAPIAGVVTERVGNAGEQTAGRSLFTIVDTSSVWAELSVFPGDRARVGVGADVSIAPATGGDAVMGTISYINVMTVANQAVLARVVLDNSGGDWPPGTFVTGDVKVGEYEVPLAVRRSGLQSFRDFTVVYAQIGDEYEVRMLDLGRQEGEWAEVLGGLDPGTRYVTENSYVLKADIEKAGAAHDH